MQSDIGGQQKEESGRPEFCCGFAAYSPEVCRAAAHNHPPSAPRSPSSERGSTLIISLIILIILMLLGVTAVTTSNTQYKLAGNLQFEDAAMNNAETAISTGENWLRTGTNFNNAGFTTRNAANTPHLYPIGALADTTPLTMTWDDANSIQVPGNPSQRYILEQMSSNSRLTGSSALDDDRASAICNRVNTYRITARGTSMRGATRFVQSYYSVLSCPSGG